MIRRRSSLAALMGLVALVALGLGLMKLANEWLARGLVLSACGLLLAATLAAIVRRSRRSAWAGVAVFGWGYALLVAGAPYLADQYGTEEHFDIWQVDGAVGPISQRLHPELARPVDPFPDSSINIDPTTGGRTRTTDRVTVPMTPGELRLQLANEAQEERYKTWSRAGRYARGIGLAIQGLAFALIGGALGQALEGRPPSPGASPGAEAPTSPG